MPLQRRLAVSYLVMFVLCGVTVSFLGPAIPYLAELLGKENGDFGIAFSLQSIGGFVGALVFGALLERRGHRSYATVVVLSGLCVVALAWSTTFATVLAASVALGAFGGSFDLGGNVFLVRAVRSGLGPWMNALHLCFAIGAFLTPGVIYLSRELSDSLKLAGVALLIGCGIAAAVLISYESPDPVVDVLADGRRPPGPRLIAVVSIFFLLYVGMEVTCAAWLPSFVDDEGIGGSAADTIVTTVFFASFALGRLVSIWLLRRLTSWHLLIGGGAVALIGAAIMLIGHTSYGAVLVGSAAFGLGVAPQYATMITTAEAVFTLSSRVSSSFSACGSLAIITIPWFVGRRMNSVGPVAMPQVLVIMAVLTLAWTFVVRRELARRAENG